MISDLDARRSTGQPVRHAELADPGNSALTAQPATAGPRIPGKRIDADPESVERGLVCLVLTVVELLRQLMERQALRRVDQGDLTGDQIEKIGLTLMALEDRMGELTDHFRIVSRRSQSGPGPTGTTAAAGLRKEGGGRDAVRQ